MEEYYALFPKSLNINGEEMKIMRVVFESKPQFIRSGLYYSHIFYVKINYLNLGRKRKYIHVSIFFMRIT